MLIIKGKYFGQNRLFRPPTQPKNFLISSLIFHIFFLQIHKNLKEMVRSTKNFEILVLKMTKNIKMAQQRAKEGQIR